MKHNAAITVKSIQHYGEEQSEIKLTSDGAVEEYENGFRAEYTEISDDNVRIHTVFTVKGSLVKIERRGSAASDLVIQKDKAHRCNYRTPYGEIILNTFGEKIHLNGCGAELIYTLEANAEFLSRNEVKISYKLFRE